MVLGIEMCYGQKDFLLSGGSYNKFCFRMDIATDIFMLIWHCDIFAIRLGLCGCQGRLECEQMFSSLLSET